MLREELPSVASPVMLSGRSASSPPQGPRFLSARALSMPGNSRKPFRKKKAPFPPFNPIRVAARAVIVRDGKLLVVILRDESGPFYILPGGGQNHGETLSDAVRRECAEELGIQVRPKKMLYLREYIGRNHAFKARHRAFHQVEVVFECEIENEENIGHGSEEDKRQVGFAWLPLPELRNSRFFPSVFKTFLTENNTLEIPYGYLGDIN